MARLEERMNTLKAESQARQAEYKTGMGELQADMARRIDALAADNARLAAENARRETRLVVTFAGLLAVAVAFLSWQD